MESTTKDLKSYTVDANITLTENEQQIFTTLMNVVKAYQLSSTLRVAGGWVRDKIMGKHSYDIDIAIDDMTGE